MSSFFPAAPAKTDDEKAAERAEAEERTEERKNQANLARERTAVVLAMLNVAVVAEPRGAGRPVNSCGRMA